ncbi:MAG: hypothetical protein L3J31_08245 [Bacteroidales bacterium]|nr:hypothetical protein [Bacteroidales bacterium]MCF6342778.1 hypothetical protein [Bacteroidales bacterium]
MYANNSNNGLNTKVDFLKYLKVNAESDEWGRLLIIKASGVSENGLTGVPVLLRTGDQDEELTDGILEFNFVIQKPANGLAKRIEWDIAVVYQMDLLPRGIKAIKVNAALNADIALLLN